MGYEMINGDALTELPRLIERGVRVSLVNADIPYFKVKADEWDRQWKDEGAFLAWVGEVCGLLTQVMRPNSSLYLYASPQMARKVGNVVAEHFNVLNEIVWVKPCPKSEINRGASNSGRMCKETMRSFYPNTERVIFAEHYGADNMAKGEADVFVFQPLLNYFTEEFRASRLSRRRVDEYFKTVNVSQYWLQARDFIIPTAERYAGLQALAPGYFRRDYEDLRRDYEDLRRPFTVSANVPYTDVWDFPTVLDYPGKHPCEKPYAMMEHIVRASSREGDLALDLCAGSGVFGEAAIANGRSVIAIEKDGHWARRAAHRAARVNGQRVPADIPRLNRQPIEMPLFGGVQ